MVGSMKKNTQKMQRAMSDPQVHPTVTLAQWEAEQSTAFPSAAVPDVLETTAPTTVGGRIPTTGPSTAPAMLSREEVEMLLRQLRPDLNLTQALESLTAGQPVSTPTPPAPSQPIVLPSRIEINIVENEEGGDEWFDALAITEAPTGKKGEEDVYSGTTEILSDGGTEVENMGAEVATAEMEVEKPEELNRGDMVEQPVRTERGVDKAEMVNTGESNVAESKINPIEEIETNPTEGMKMHPTEVVGVIHTEATMDDVVVVTDGEDEGEKEPPKEMAGQGMSCHVGGQTGNIVGASVPRRRLLVDEVSEEEEEDVIFQPIGEPQSQRRPVREELLVYKKRQSDVPTRETVDEGDRERMRRKMKGKEVANPAKKKMKLPSMAVEIQEPNPDVGGSGREEESDEEQALRWERRSKKRNDEAQSGPRERPEEVRPQIKKSLVRLDCRLLA